MKLYNSQFAKEFHTHHEIVELTVLLDGRDERVRIEAVEGPKGVFSTRAYIQRSYLLTPVEQRDTSPEAVLLWSPFDLAPTSRTLAGDAIDQALAFLADRCRRDDSQIPDDP
jgi:hypothetical protein